MSLDLTTIVGSVAASLHDKLVIDADQCCVVASHMLEALTLRALSGDGVVMLCSAHISFMLCR